jgi:hypothetical protein
MYMIFGTCNGRGHYKARSLKRVASRLAEYELDLAGGVEPAYYYVVYLSLRIGIIFIA